MECDSGGCWNDFCTRCLFWPAVVQIVIMILLSPLSSLWVRLQLKDTVWIVTHLGKKDSKPRKPHCMAVLWTLQLLTSLASVALWVRRTNLQNSDGLSVELPLASVFIIGYLARLTRNEFRPAVCLCGPCLIDVFTTVPAIMDMGENSWISLSFFRVYRALDAFKQIEDMGILDVLTDFRRALLFLLLRAICMIITLAGITFTLEVLGELPGLETQLIETGMGKVSMIETIYFTISTISTVGYGDFSPSTIPSRCFNCFMIVIGVLFFSVETTNILELQNLLNTGKGSYRVKRNTPHVIVIGGGVEKVGEVCVGMVKEFFGEHHKVSPGWPDVVFMCPTEQDRSLQEFLRTLPPEKTRKIFYFVGSIMRGADCERICLRKASMVYILTDVSASNKAEEDGFNLLRALSVRKYSPTGKLRLMLLRPEFKEQAVNAGIGGEYCFSVDEMKATFLAHCCRCPGLITVIANLTDSEAVDTSYMADGEGWMKEYCEGSNSAIFGMVVSPRYAGCTWTQLSLRMYQDANVILVAAQLNGRTVLNPGFVSRGALAGGEVCFVIATSPDDLDKVRNSEDWSQVFAKRKKRASEWMQEDLRFEEQYRVPISEGVEGDELKEQEDEDGDGEEEWDGGNDGNDTKSVNHEVLEDLAGVSRSASQGTLERSKSAGVGRMTAALEKEKQFRPHVKSYSVVSGASGHRQSKAVDDVTAAKVSRPLDLGVGGHIVLISCSSGPVQWEELQCALVTLRTPLRAWEHKPVAVLAAQRIPSQISALFPDVCFVYGSASSVTDLEAVAVRKAAMIVLLAGDSDCNIVPELRDHRTVVVANTLEMVLSYQCRTFVMYELHVESSAEFMPTPLLGSRRAGDERLSTYKNLETDSFEVAPVKMHPQFASGQVFTLGFLGDMLGREYYVPSTMELLQALVMPARRGQSSFPWFVPVPEDFVGETFATLYEAWTTDAATPISVYKSFATAPDQYGYVITKPSPDLVLSAKDHVYVLASGTWGYDMLHKDIPPPVPAPAAALSQASSGKGRASSGNLQDLSSTRASEKLKPGGGPGRLTQAPAPPPPAEGPATAPSSEVADPAVAAANVPQTLSMMTKEIRSTEERMQNQLAGVQKDLRSTEVKVSNRLDRIEGSLQEVLELFSPTGTPGAALGGTASLLPNAVPEGRDADAQQGAQDTGLADLSPVLPGAPL